MWNGHEALFETCHIAQLPNEILTEVLHYVSTRQLLRCRGVSSRWNQLALSACRQRHVEVPLCPCGCGLNDIRPENLCLPQHFLDMTSAPWSAIELDFPLVTCREEALTDIPRHLDTFLSLMTKLTVSLTGGHVDGMLFRVLERMASLNSLCIDIPDDCLPNADLKPPVDMDLDRWTLKEADIEFTGSHILDFVLSRNVTSVRRVTLRQLLWPDIDGQELGTVFSRIWSRVKDIETVTLTVTYDGATTMDWSRLLVNPIPNLKRLEVDAACFVDRNAPPSPNQFKMLEEFLGKGCQHLESLSLTGFNVVAAAGHRFENGGIAVEVPALPNLRDLYIKANGGLRHLSAQPFPKLQSVNLECGYRSDGVLDLAAAFGANGVFSTVRSLDLDGFNGKGTWGTATAFPNLKVMSVKVNNAAQLAAALSAAIGLDELTIGLEPHEREDGFLLPLYSIVNPFVFRKVPPGIELKKLVVRTPANHGLCDRSARVFTLLKPLHLVLWNAQNLSENCLSGLRNHHHALHLEQE